MTVNYLTSGFWWWLFFNVGGLGGGGSVLGFFPLSWVVSNSQGKITLVHVQPLTVVKT